MSMTKTLYTSIALLAGVTLNAQQSPDSSNALDPVVVTATKYPVKLSETGKVVTVISSADIEHSQGKTLAQILTEQSGVIVNGAGSNPGKDKTIFLRGATNKYTLILLDGVPISDPSGPGGAFDLRLFPVEQIDRIEILKGSQSTLYGADAIAGVINIITRKGGGKKVAVNGAANYGTYNSFNGSAGVNGSTKTFDYNVNYTYSSSDGISESIDTTGKAGFDKDGFMRNSLQANLSFRPTKNLRISPYYRYSYYNGGFDADAFTDGGNQFNALLNNSGASAVLDLPKGNITANYGYTYSRRSYNTAFGPSAFRGRFHAADIYLTQRLNETVKLLAGVNYQTYRLLDTTLDKVNPKANIASPYASFFFENPNGLNVELGGRYNHHSEFGGHLTYSFNASYNVSNRVKLFASLSSGFKAPSVTDLFGPAFYGSNPELKPELSRNVEAGAQVKMAEGRLLVTATGYYRDITDMIAYVGTRLINIDEQKDKGAELEAAFRPNEKLSFKVAYNFVTGNLHQSRDGKDTSFYNLIRRPKHAVLATVGWQATKNLYVSVSAQSYGERSDLYFGPPDYMGQQVALDAYALFNAYAEYALAAGRVKVFVDGRNLTDADYTEVYGYSTMGINVNGGFRFNL